MKKKMPKTTIYSMTLLALALTIVGCASVTYEEPKSGPVAKVRFVSDTEDITIVRSYRSKQCDDEHEMMRLRNGFFLNSDPRLLGIPLWNYHKNAAKEFFIRAGIPQVYMFECARGNRYRYKCGVIIQQTFDEGKDYEISYKWNNYDCNVQIYEIKPNNLGGAKKVLLHKGDKNLPPGFSKACLEKFKQGRLF